MWETQVRSLVGKIPLEKGVASHSSIFAWRIPWTEATAPGVPENQTMTEGLRLPLFTFREAEEGRLGWESRAASSNLGLRSPARWYPPGHLPFWGFCYFIKNRVEFYS